MELPRFVFAASPLPAVAPVAPPSVADDAGVDAGCPALAAGLEKRLVGALDVAVALEVGAAERAPPRLGKGEVADAGAAVAVVLVEVAAVPAVLAGVDAAGLLNKLKPGLGAGVLDAAGFATDEKRLGVGAADDGAAELAPPRLKAGVVFVGAAEAPPRVKPPEGLLAGVEEGVVLPMLLNSPEPGAAFVALPLFASPEATEPKSPVLGVEADPACGVGAALPNMLGVADEDVVAGFAPPKSDVGGCAVPLPVLLCCPNKEEPLWAPLAAGFCPKRLLPGGAPAGVVDGRNDVLFAAGVAAAVDVVPEGVPNVNDGAEDAAALEGVALVPAPPKSPPPGLGASPPSLNPPNVGVEAAPAVA